MADNKTNKGTNHARDTLRDVFGLVEYQQNATYASGYNLTSIKNDKNAVLNHAGDVEKSKVVNSAIKGHVPHNTPNIE